MKMKTELVRRFTSKTPKFWRKVQLAGLILTTAGLAVTTLPISVPAAIAGWATYATVIGGSLTTISQFAESEDENDKVSSLDDIKDSFKNILKKTKNGI